MVSLRKKQVKQRKQVSNGFETKRERKEEGEQRGTPEIPLAGAPESPSITSPETKEREKGVGE